MLTSENPSSDEHCCAKFMHVSVFPCITLMKETVTMEPAHVPVATPSRALAMFWSKYKVPKPQHNPMKPSSTDVPVEPHVEPAASSHREVPAEPHVERAEVPAEPVEPAASSPTEVHTVDDINELSSATVTAGEPVIAADVTKESSVDPPGSSGGTGSGGLNRGASSASFATDDLESGWRYDEKCKKQAAKLAAPVPGDDPPSDGPTIACAEPSSVPDQPSSSLDISMGDTASAPPMPSDASPVPTTDLKPTESFLQEFNKLCCDEAFDPIVQRLEKNDRQQIDAKILEVQKHPSFPGFLAHMRTLFVVEGGTYKFGSDHPTEELAAFETWCQAEMNCNAPPPAPPVPESPQVSAVRAILTRATTVDLTPASAKQPPAVKVEPVSDVPAPAARPVISSVFFDSTGRI